VRAERTTCPVGNRVRGEEIQSEVGGERAGERRGTRPGAVAPAAVADGARIDAGIVTVAVTCRRDARSHHVPDTELTRTAAADTGRYHAVCGYVVSPAPLVEPDGKPCDACAEMTGTARKRRKGRRRSA
jgi:hypothetical protein